MKHKSNPWPAIGWIVGATLAISLAIWMEIGIWNECRETNSFWYCMRVLSK